MTPDATRPRAPRGAGSRLRDELLDATGALLTETGDADQVSIRAVCGRVGVTPPSVYLHFADKDDLIFAVCAREFARLDAFMDEAAAGAADPVDALRRRGRAYVQFGLDRPEHYRLLFMSRHSGITRPETQPELPGTAAFSHLVDAVQACVDAGAFAADTDAFAAAATIWTGVHGVTSLLITLPDFPWGDVDALVARSCDTQLRALLSRGPSAPR
jgi:AcrR family transcriptional regulator